MLTNPIECPVCDAKHDAIARVGSYNVIACDQVTPTGNVMFFPRRNVMAVGAGLWVDSSPPQKLTPAQLQGQIDAIKTSRGVVAPPPPGKSVEELEAELETLKQESP